MSPDLIKDFTQQSKKLSGRLQDLAKNKDNQKEAQKIINDIKKIQKEMEKSFQQIGPFLEKKHIDKQGFNNANNDLKRALNQPSEGNILNAMNKMNDFINKLAA